MFYFDTSFLAPLILPEATSDRIAKFISGLAAEKLTVSHWARVEFSSLLAREVRMGGLEAQFAVAADAQFEDILKESFLVLLPNADDFALAKQFLGNYEFGLRAGDALHLAIAGNHRAEAVYSLDKTMIRAGKNLGLPVSAGIRLPGYED
jgi:predicted nucleic acid-binding protein